MIEVRPIAVEELGPGDRVVERIQDPDEGTLVGYVVERTIRELPKPQGWYRLVGSSTRGRGYLDTIVRHDREGWLHLRPLNAGDPVYRPEPDDVLERIRTESDVEKALKRLASDVRLAVQQEVLGDREHIGEGDRLLHRTLRGRIDAAQKEALRRLAT